MTRRSYIIVSILSIFCFLTALWQGVEVSRLNSRLHHIDEESQIERLMQLSLPRIKTLATSLLQEEVTRLGEGPDLSIPRYNVDGKGKADFNQGYFLLTPQNLLVPDGEKAFEQHIALDPQLLDTMRRKADNPNAPLFNPNEEHILKGSDAIPVFGTYEVKDTDFSKEIKRTGKADPYFAWSDGKQLIYMRSIPTSHGRAAEGIIIDTDLLIARLQTVIEPELKQATISPRVRGEQANLSPLPLVLHPGDDVNVPKDERRESALLSTIISSWLFCASSTLLFIGLLLLFIRYEHQRSDMISAVTHELKTPLTSLRLATEMLKEGMVPEEKIESYHNNLHTESLRLSHLVENVLAFARISHSTGKGRPDTGKCQELLPPLLDKIAEHMKSAGFEFHYTIDRRCQMMQIRTDLVLLEQILTNLADNSIKYGKGKKAVASILVEQQRRTISLRFSDKGTGIEERMKEQIFIPFKRSTAQSGKPGIGLGLALSRDLARGLGGELKLESSNARGTHFVLTLPVGQA